MMDIQARIEELERIIDHKCAEARCYRSNAPGIVYCDFHMTGGDHIYSLEERIRHELAVTERDLLTEEQLKGSSDEPTTQQG